MAFEDAGMGVALGGDGGGSADSGGGDSGFSGGGDEGGAGAGSEEVLSGDQGGEQGAGDQSQQEFEVDENGEQKLDEQGNPIPKAPAKADFKTNYAKIKAADPAAADAFRKNHFELQSYKNAFASTKDATAAKELLETFGGQEGIEQLNGQAQQFQQEMEKFSQGDPEFIAQLAKDDPEGFAKTATPYLQTLASANPQAYAATLAPILAATFQQHGFVDGLQEVGNLLDTVYGALKAAGKVEHLSDVARAYKSLAKLHDVTQQFGKMAEQSAERPLTDREKALQQREQQLTQQQTQQWVGDTQAKVTASTDGLIDKALQTYYKNAKLTNDQKADLQKGVWDYVAAQLKSNKNYMTQLRTLMNKRDTAKVVNYVEQNVSKIVQASAKTVWNRRGFGTLPNQGKGAQGGKQIQGTATLTQKPKNSDVDWTQTSELDYMSGNAVLKGTGRKVKWSWSDQK